MMQPPIHALPTELGFALDSPVISEGGPCYVIAGPNALLFSKDEAEYFPFKDGLVAYKEKTRTDSTVTYEMDMENSVNVRHRYSQKLGKRMFCYAARHGFGTRKLIQGHDPITVAGLMGHTDGSMLAKVYSHVDEDDDHMNKALVD